MSRELAEEIHTLNQHVLRAHAYWRGDIFDLVTLALIDGQYEPGSGSLAKLARTFDGWGEIYACLAMECYDRRDVFLAAEDAAT